MSELKELTEKIKGIVEPLDLGEENEKAESLWLDSDFHIAKLQNEASFNNSNCEKWDDRVLWMFII